jgi:hypothetical protein
MRVLHWPRAASFREALVADLHVHDLLCCRAINTDEHDSGFAYRLPIKQKARKQT